MFLEKQSAYHGTVQRKFDDVMSDYFISIEGSLTAKTMDRYAQSLLILTDHFGGKWWDDIDKHAVLEFIKARKALGRSIRTIKNDLNVLSGAAQFAMENDWGGTNPVTQISKRVLRYKAPVFKRPSLQNIETALSNVHGPLQGMCRFIRATGLRRDEAVFLRWQDIDSERRSATLTDTKNGQTRTISLSDEAVRLLPPQRLGTPLVFPKLDGKPYKQASGGWREAQNRALKDNPRYQRFPLHGLRHIYAIEYLEAGGGLYILKEQLGHSSVRQTEWYLQFLTPEEQETVKLGTAQNPAQLHRFASAKGAENA